MSSYSKAPWGLFVQQQVTGIFTGSSISPSLWLRECSSRYAFRAGRNFAFCPFSAKRTMDLSIIANGADYIFVLCSPFIWRLRKRIFSTFSVNLCWRFFIIKHISLNNLKDSFLVDIKGCSSKWGIILVSKSFRDLTSYLIVLSDLSGRIEPHPK